MILIAFVSGSRRNEHTHKMWFSLFYHSIYRDTGYLCKSGNQQQIVSHSLSESSKYSIRNGNMYIQYFPYHDRLPLITSRYKSINWRNSKFEKIKKSQIREIQETQENQEFKKLRKLDKSQEIAAGDRYLEWKKCRDESWKTLHTHGNPKRAIGHDYFCCASVPGF